MIWLFSASSTRRQSQELVGTFMAPLSRAATKKNQKFSARSHIRQGILQAIKSKIAVVFRRPSLSVMGPLKKAKTTWESM